MRIIIGINDSANIGGGQLTIKDIAEKAGVSMITVSRVMRTPMKVAENTRKRILEIIEQENYIHNTAAHNLASNKSGIICVFAFKEMELQDPFFLQFIIGVGSYLSQENYSIQIVYEIKKNQFCDGYIMSGYNYSKNVLEEAKATGKPVALFSSHFDPKVDCMDTDNIKSSEMLISYLIDKGHRKIAIILNNITGPYPKERFQGYLNALKKNGIVFDERLFYTVDNSVKGGNEAANWFIDNRIDATAIFLITDIMAVGFISGVKERGLSVPGDISVVGFDGLGHHLMSSPKISTVKQPVYEISRALSKCILDRIRNPEIPYEHRLVDGVLEEEESVRENY